MKVFNFVSFLLFFFSVFFLNIVSADPVNILVNFGGKEYSTNIKPIVHENCDIYNFYGKNGSVYDWSSRMIIAQYNNKGARNALIAPYLTKKTEKIFLTYSKEDNLVSYVTYNLNKKEYTYYLHGAVRTENRLALVTFERKYPLRIENSILTKEKVLDNIRNEDVNHVNNMKSFYLPKFGRSIYN